MGELVRFSHLPPLPPAEYFEYPLFADACRIYWADDRIVALRAAVVIAADLLTASEVEANLPLAVEMTDTSAGNSKLEPQDIPVLRDYVMNDGRLAPDAESATAIRSFFRSKHWSSHIAHEVRHCRFAEADFKFTGKIRKRPVSIALDREYARRQGLLDNAVVIEHPASQHLG